MLFCKKAHLPTRKHEYMPPLQDTIDLCNKDERQPFDEWNSNYFKSTKVFGSVLKRDDIVSDAMHPLTMDTECG